MRNGTRNKSRSVDRRSRSGWSLIEMLIVISVMGILASLVLPAIQSARQAAARAQCQNNLRQIGLALTAHATTHGQLPGGGARSARSGPREVPRAFDGQPYRLEHQTWGWAYQVLPFMDQTNRWLNSDDQTVRESHIPLYLCPSQEGDSFQFADATLGAMHYVGNACSNCDLADSDRGSGQGKKGNRKKPPGKALGWGRGTGTHDGVFVQTLDAERPGDVQVLRKPQALDNIQDGLSNTVFVTEKRRLASLTPCNETTGWVSGYPFRQGNVVYGHDTLFSGREGAPAEDVSDESIQCTSRAGGPHGIGANVLFGDGSVRFMAFGTNADLWRALLSVNGKEDIDMAAGEVSSP